MRIFNGYRDLPHDARGAVVAMGNFDGVHRGHAGLIAEARSLASQLSAPLGVLTFEPHPRTIFRPGDPAFRLTTPQQKARLIEALDVDCLYTLPFSREFSLKAAAQFEREVLVEGLGIRGAVAGANFLFGHNRAGTLTELHAAGERHGFIVVEAATLRDERGEAYSSTRLRQALADARPDEAAHLLGRCWEIETVVERGDQRGRVLGFPTANGQLGELLRPAYGIYAVRIRIGNSPNQYPGVANIGIRPMWESTQPLIETHIFDFDEDIYGQHVQVDLVSFLRREAKFNDIEALKAQMAEDCVNARACLNSDPTN